MESTGKYWIPVFNILEKSCSVTLAHPKYTKPQKGNKTDRKDAKWICDLFMCDMIKPSFIPSPEIRQLRDLVRYRVKLTNVFGKSARSIANYILEHPGETFDVSPFVDPRCKTPVSEIQAAVDGTISPEQTVKLRQCLVHIVELEAHRKEIESEILQIAEPFSAVLDLLYTLPGLDKNPMTAIAILSEIGPDMSVFPSSKHLVSWAGCCPRNDQSNQKVKSRRISRAGSYLKPLLVQVANALIKSKKHPESLRACSTAFCDIIPTAIFHFLTSGAAVSSPLFCGLPLPELPPQSCFPEHPLSQPRPPPQ